MLDGKRVLVTGGYGFIGKAVTMALAKSQCSSIRLSTHEALDLLNGPAVEARFAEAKPDIVIHLAAAVGGIGAHLDTPGSYLFQNLQMGLNVIEACRKVGVEKFVTLGTSCSYPEHASNPLREEDLWNGKPNASTGPYGIAKMTLTEMLQGYHRQYGFNSVTLIPANVYGPGDHFDLQRGHVIPSLILKCAQAKRAEKPLEIWGSGKASREFVYIDDMVWAIIQAASYRNDPSPLNIGTGQETSILAIAHCITKAMDFEGEIVWDTTKPDGQMSKCFDISKAVGELGYLPMWTIVPGIKETVRWFQDNHGSLLR
jgi:GDP-L-fucose synthase